MPDAGLHFEGTGETAWGTTFVVFAARGEDTHSRVLRRVRTHRTKDKTGNYRWYNHYELPAEYGDATITVRLHSTADDTARGLNRTENVRPIPPTDPDFTDLFRRRIHQPSPRRHALPAQGTQHRPPPPTREHPRLRGDRQLAHTPPASPPGPTTRPADHRGMNLPATTNRPDQRGPFRVSGRNCSLVSFTTAVDR
ncbi:MAG: hypothetical protein M5U31_01025 [Acidimicrobiia bacterium]|nr:hypothetical protein [Acidimicrobiia bacterium]